MIFISAGHYPEKPGARWERFVEHDEAVVWAQKLHEELDDSMLVPTGVLKSKVGFINERAMSGDVALEIHFNAARDGNDNPVGRGCETLYYPGSENGKKLAEVCQAAMAEHFSPDRGVKEGWYQMNPDKGPDFFLARTTCPAVILEPEFVHRSEIIAENCEVTIKSLADALKKLDEGDA